MNVVGKSIGILASHDMHHTGSNIDFKMQYIIAAVLFIISILLRINAYLIK